VIKLIRGTCPSALSKEVVDKLTEIYIKDKEKDVWNDSSIKEPLKKALTDMSCGKCAYCECKLNIESKDVTIDHFKPKVANEDIVVEWDNLVPSCLRCNRSKNRKEDEIINPCEIDPKQHLGVKKDNKYRIKEKDILGKNTRKVLDLNNIDRLMTARMQICEKLVDKLFEIEEDINSMGMKKRYIDRFEKVLIECRKDTEYSAIKATNILSNDSYSEIKKFLRKNDSWNIRLQRLEDELLDIAFDLI
jgi:uncharacterized protein (TIGR02646 family)